MKVFDLDGRKILEIKGLEQDSDKVYIFFDDGSTLIQSHDQYCCEIVLVEQVDGDVERHIGANAVVLNEKTIDISDNDFPEDIKCSESCTATFYSLVTTKGRLDWRWVGESNGYYSETVDVDWKGEQWVTRL